MLNEAASERERIERFWDARSKESELNYAVFMYAMRCVAEGDVDALRRIGFVPEDVPILDQLRMADLQALAASRAHALDIRIDRDAMQRLMDTMHRRRTRERLKQELLRLEAPLQMMAALFGMNAREYTAARDRIGVTGGIGRPRTQIDDDEARIWRLWVQLADAWNPQKLRHDDLWLVIGREEPSQLRNAWTAIQRWSCDPVTLQSFDSERTQHSTPSIADTEAALRTKHGVSPIEIEAAPLLMLSRLPADGGADNGTDAAV